MKLAEALQERADANRRLQELRQRILRNAKHQEGEAPAESPNELLQEYEAAAKSLENLITQINITNNSIALANGTSMVAALAHRDTLKIRHSMYTSLAAEATPSYDRYSKTEIKFIASVSVADMQRKADKLAQEYRALDTLIQQANWTHELL